jgi:5-methylcytosine-specific restriction protein A
MTKPAHDAWYKTYRWQKLRARHLASHPLCVMCEEEGRATPATICDHVEPHRGDPEKFWSGPFQSLCAAHHNSDKQRLEKSGKKKTQIGVDGWPTEE